jgi:hypothetical protein
MIVARQFIAWNRPHEEHRPVGDGMIIVLVWWCSPFCYMFLGFLRTSSRYGKSRETIPHTVPTGRIFSCA